MADPFGSVEKIVKVGLLIKEAVDKVRRNKEDCREINKRVVRVSALLTRVQETEMMNDPATGRALEELEETLTVAHELVMACRRKNVLSHFCTAGGLAKRLREVKQDISDLMVDGIFATNVNATIILTNIQFAACNLPQKAWEVRNAVSTRGFLSRSWYSDVAELSQMRRCIEVGLLCTQLRPADRPTIADVIQMLNGSRELQVPKKPRYTKKIARPNNGRKTISSSFPA